MSGNVSLLDTDYSLLEFAKDAGMELPAQWLGRTVTLEELSDFADKIEPHVLSLFQSLITDTKAFNQLAIRFAREGTEDRDLLERDIQQLICTPEGVFSGGVGCGKNLGKFWRKHKKGILIGAAIFVVAVGVTTIIVCTGGAAGAAAGTAGAAAIKGLSGSLDKKEAKPAQKETTQNPPAEKPPQNIGIPPDYSTPPPSLHDFLSPKPVEPIYPSGISNGELDPFTKSILFPDKDYMRNPFPSGVPSPVTNIDVPSSKGYTMPDPPPDSLDAWDNYYQNFYVERRKEAAAEWKRSHTDNYASSVYYGRPTNKINTPSPFREVPLIGEPDQSTIHFFPGINNDVPTAFRGGFRLHETLDKKYAIHSHLLHSNNIATGLALVGLEKINQPNIKPLVAGFTGPLLALLPELVLEHSSIQRSINYEVEMLSKIAQNIIKKSNPNLKQVYVTFSNAGYVTNEALKLLSPKHRKTIIVITAGTTAIVDTALACKAYNVIGAKDWPSKMVLGGLDAIEKAKNRANIILVDQEETDGIVGGHYFLQPDYQRKIADILKEEIIGNYEIY